jgi:superfamily II DNA helicase RecQ
MTNEARTILNLFVEVARLRSFGGITLFQLSELYKGSKSKSSLKGFEKCDLNRVKGYGDGNAFKKHELDRIMHAMIFERLLLESGVDTKGGFSIDYVNLGENAQALLHGSSKLIVEVPRAQRKTSEKSKKDSAKKKTKEKTSPKKKAPSIIKKAPPPAKASKKSASTSNDMNVDGGLQFTEGGSDSDDDSWDGGESLRTGRASSAKNDSPTVLPSNHVTALAKEIKLLTSMWADEEQLYGNEVYCKYDFFASRVGLR